MEASTSDGLIALPPALSVHTAGGNPRDSCSPPLTMEQRNLRFLPIYTRELTNRKLGNCARPSNILLLSPIVYRLMLLPTQTNKDYPFAPG